MDKVLDVAKYLIQLAEAGDEPDRLSHLRLQKLLYYTQGWSLVFRKKRLFSEKIEAWAHGPVVPAVYSKFAIFQSSVIPPENFLFRKGSLSEDDCNLISAVWDEYKKFSATRLRELTHKEPPWERARKGCAPGEKSQAEITQTAMKKYFRSLVHE